ncbi:MAG: hypothetical protein ACJ797_02150 [Ktedonobacteraceae bacterium]
MRIRPADLTHVGLPTSGDSPEEQNEIRDASERVVVVAARFALDENRKCSAYICQAHRSFRRCVRMTFYTKNKFDRRISKILGQYASTYQMELDDP